MEKYIKIESQHPGVNTVIEVDNTVDLKDFRVVMLDEKRKAVSSVDLQISRTKPLGKEVILTIGKTTLIGREVELLKEFLNQEL